MVSGFLSCFELKSALAELRSATGCLEAVFLSLLHTRVSCKQPRLLENGSVFLICLKKCAGYAMAYRAGLTGYTAAGDRADNIKLTGGIRNRKRLTNDELERIKPEIIINITLVYRNGTRTGKNTYSRDRTLSSARAVKIRSCGFVHDAASLPDLNVDGLLSPVLVLTAAVNAETVDARCADGVLGQHAFYGKSHRKLRLALHDLLVADFLETAYIAGMSDILLLLELLAGKHYLVGVQHYDRLAAVYMGRIFGSVLAVKYGRSSSSYLAERLTACIYDIPSALKRFFFCHECGHFLPP